MTGGDNHSMILLQDCKTVYVSGLNDHYQLGLDKDRFPGFKSWEKIQFFDINNNILYINSIKCGWGYSVILSTSGDVYLLGKKSRYFPAAGPVYETDLITEISYIFAKTSDFESKIYYQKLDIYGTRAVKLACGPRHLMILTDEGNVLAMGWNRHHQISNQPQQIIESPTIIYSEKNAVDISCGIKHSIIVAREKTSIIGSKSALSSGIPKSEKLNVERALCGWNMVLLSLSDTKANSSKKIVMAGSNNHGQLGRGFVSREESSFESPKFDFSDEQTDIRDLAIGSEHVILRLGDDLYTWGWNEHGNLGNGNLLDSFKPVKIDSLQSIRLVGTGYGFSFVVAKRYK